MSLISAHKELRDFRLCLAVWFNKRNTAPALNQRPVLPIASSDEAYLLEVAPQFGFLKMVHAQADSYGLGSIKKLHHWMVSPQKLEQILASGIKEVPELAVSLKNEDDFEILHIDQQELGPSANRIFGRQFSLPDNAREAWYLSTADYEQYKKTRQHLALNASATTAILITEESPDFLHRKGLMFSKDINLRWRPNTPQGVGPFTWYRDAKMGKPGYFILGGNLDYSIVGFEFISKPSAATFLLFPSPDNMYVEVLLKKATP